MPKTNALSVSLSAFVLHELSKTWVFNIKVNLKINNSVPLPLSEN